MAAPNGTTWGSIVGGYGRIGIYTSLSSTKTHTTPKTQIWFWSKYSVSDTANTLYYTYDTKASSATSSKGSKSIKTTVDSGSGWSTSNQVKIYEYTHDAATRDTAAKTRYLYAKLAGVDRVGGTMYVSKTISIPKLDSYTVSYNANGGSGAPGNQTKWYGNALTLSKTVPTRTGYTFQGWATSASGAVAYKAGSSYTGNAALTLYAIWKINTWTVSYNANGGSGAPANQTKTYGKTLVISTTKPTRTGYDFQGWGTSASDTSVDYAAGSNYTDNKAITLYAIWKLKTYTITFNANGGSGAPGKQTKQYGVTLTLSSTKPTKANYNFKGWATSATATTISYQAGGKYTSNANVTLYAVWELAYKKPTISNIQVSRCDGSGNPVGDDIEKSSGLISFKWTTFNTVSSIKITWKSATGDISGSSSIPNVSGTSGTVSQVFGNNTLPMDQTFTVTVTVTDSGGNTPKDITLDGYLFPIDMLGGGNGVSFGKPAELENVADFEFETLHRHKATYKNNKVIAGEKPNGTVCEAFNPQNASGNTVIGWGNYNSKSGNTNIYGFGLTFGISDVAAEDGTTWVPYRKRGHTLPNITIRTAGYVTNGGKDITFLIPFTVPIVGSPTITVSSNNGLILRQNNTYTHGSTAETYVYPESYEASYYSLHGVRITAKFKDTQVGTIVNNDTIGIYWNGTITFS